jgi:hypothetical protein
MAESFEIPKGKYFLGDVRGFASILPKIFDREDNETLTEAWASTKIGELTEFVSSEGAPREGERQRSGAQEGSGDLT